GRGAGLIRRPNIVKKRGFCRNSRLLRSENSQNSAFCIPKRGKNRIKIALAIRLSPLYTITA
ncbi:MAG: hypothetical protein IJQ25_04870, partial [Oscillibacter sp.]|nr:hypothetical protein [Oscillibacter sp.]